MSASHPLTQANPLYAPKTPAFATEALSQTGNPIKRLSNKLISQSSVSNSPSLHICLVPSSCRMLVTLGSGTRLLERRRSRVAFASAVLGVPCGWPFGIVPYWKRSQWTEECQYSKGVIPWSVILYVIFLDFLDMVIRLRVVHPFCTTRTLTKIPTSLSDQLTISMKSL